MSCTSIVVGAARDRHDRHASVTAVKADNAVRPAELTNDFIALRFVEQVRQLDQVHHGFRSLPHRERPTDQRPDQNQHTEILPRADGSLPGQGLLITPEPDKSLSSDPWQSMENQPFPTLSVISDRSELSGIGITAIEAAVEASRCRTTRAAIDDDGAGIEGVAASLPPDQDQAVEQAPPHGSSGRTACTAC
jgi:hypothetical protein